MCPDPCKPSENGPVAQCQADIQREIDNFHKQAAIDMAIRHYDIDISNAKKVKYDKNHVGDAEALSNGVVKVGEASLLSPGWLASSIAHETEVHINNQLEKGKWYEGPQGTALQEVEAYDFEIANADRFGLTDAEVERLKKRRKEYYDKLTPEYQKKADSGDYTMNPGDEKN